MRSFTLREILLAIALIVVVIVLFHSKPDPVDSRGQADSTFYWKNKYGEAVASQRASAEQFSYADARTRHLLDSLSKVYSTNAKKIQELIIATVQGRVRLVPVPGTQHWDTPWEAGTCPPVLKNVREQFSNPYYTADVQLGDSSYLNLDSRDTITGIWREVRVGSLFHRKKYLQLDVHLADTSRHVTGLTAYRRLIQPKEFSLNLTGAIVHSNGSFSPVLAVGLQRSFNRWEAELSVGRNLSPQNFNFCYGQAQLTYKLIRF